MSARWLLRVDDRLVHGQVIVGWCDALDIRQLVLADDEIAACEFEQELYGSCLAEEQSLRFMSLQDLADAMDTAPELDTMVVLSGLESLDRLRSLVSIATEITLGGLHDQAGARQVNDYIFLTPEQEQLLGKLLDSGLQIVGQPLPCSPKLDLGKLLKS